MQEEEEESLTAVITVALIIVFAEFFYWFLNIFVVENIIKNEALKTASYVAALTLNDYLATYFYVKNIYYIFPACLGAAAGAFLAVKCNEKRKKKNDQDQS